MTNSRKVFNELKNTINKMDTTFNIIIANAEHGYDSLNDINCVSLGVELQILERYVTILLGLTQSLINVQTNLREVK